jgi:glucose-1-phosphate cytidylyltransferase
VKVVLFCGGQGLRLRTDGSEAPKPMALIGYRPILWHVMRWYAHFGHTEFILCLGYKAEVVKRHFLEYSEALSNDFVLSDGGRTVDLLSTDIHDWRITFVDTGLHASVGERLRAVERYIGDDEMFLANYGDTLTDAPLPAMIEDLERSDQTASFLCVRPNYTFHVVDHDDDGCVSAVTPIQDTGLWINGGYFVFRRQVFDYLGPGEDLVNEPFARMVEKQELRTYPYEGFWAPMDTLKDRQELERLYASGERPWMLWDTER